VIDHREIVMQDIGISLVEINPLLEDGLIVPVQRQSAGVVGARALEAAGLDLEQVVAAIALLSVQWPME